MSNNIKKVLFVFLVILLMIGMPKTVLASNEEIAVISTKTLGENGTENIDFLIYIKGYTKTKFKYAFSNKENPEAIDLNYINSASDNLENQVAILSNEKYVEMSAEPIYMWAKDENGEEILTAIKIDFTDILNLEEMQNVETITKKIPVEISDTKEKVDATAPISQENIDGVIENVKVGYIKITDEEDAKYYYRLIKTTEAGDIENLMELAKKIKDTYENLDMFEKIKLCKEFNELYTKLIERTNWAEVTDKTIRQPKESMENDEYVVFIKKVAEDKEVIDVQFLVANDDYKENIEKEQIVIQETTKLPITFDNIIILILAFIIVINALIIIFIRIRKLSKKDERK